VIVVEPIVCVAAKPDPLTEATTAFTDVHCAVPVRLCVLPSLYVPVAANCCVVPKAFAGLCGVTAIETKTGGGLTTVSVVDALIPLSAAFMVVVPTPTPVMFPLFPVFVTDATLVLDVLHTADCVMS
jgi:hypothetical protein